MSIMKRKNNILIFGPPGCGKSFIVEKMKKDNIIDADKLKDLLKIQQGKVVWDENILKQYLNDKQDLYFLGIAANVFELMKEFDEVYYLQVPIDILEKRLLANERTNPAGKEAKQRSEFLHYAQYLDEKVAEFKIKKINGQLSPEQIMLEIKNYRALKNEQIMSKGKYWLRLSFACNNNCLFCLDKKDKLDNEFCKLSEVSKEIDQAFIDGYSQIILSGGEATIHPQFLNIVKYCQEKGFTKIQVITNGRMLAYDKFTKQAIASGVNEITFSVHGSDSATHDKLVQVDGAFAQVIKGIENVRKFNNVIVNIDIVINKINLKQIFEMIKFFSEKYAIFEYDLLYLVPFGNAQDNINKLKFTYSDFKKYFQPVLDLAKNDKRYHIWTNRLPANYLEDYEFLIQDPHKILDEVRGRYESLNNYLKLNKKPTCSGEDRCANCFLNDFCTKIKLYNKIKTISSKNDTIKLNKNNSKQEKDQEKIYTLETYSNLKDLIGKGLDLSKFSETLPDNLKFVNVPFCLVKKNQTSYDLLYEGKEFVDIFDFVKYYIENLYYSKSLRCKDCVNDSNCLGLHINYLRLYGYKILKPIK